MWTLLQTPNRIQISDFPNVLKEGEKVNTKCENFCNAHCAFDCPNAAIDEWESRFDLDAGRELGVARIKCGDCEYRDADCTCGDCYFQNSKECPKVGDTE